MGGGDLNLKKSWHPSTRANLEKVFLAEQNAEKEKKRLEEFQKEKKRERDANEIRKLQEAAGIIKTAPERLEWMYSARENNSEKHTVLPAQKQLVNVSDTGKEVAKQKRWDIENKLREDPLSRIKSIQKRKDSSVTKKYGRI